MEILGKLDGIEALRTRDLLEQDYLPYFTNLQVYYEHEQIDDADYQLVRDIQSKIRRSLVLVARNFLGAGATAPASRELDELNQNLSEIEAAKNKLIKKVPAQGVLHSALKEATALTGIDPKSMSLSVNISKKAKKEAKKQIDLSIGGVVGTAASMLGLSRRGLAVAGGLSQVLAPLLGPAFLPVSAAMLGGKAILKKVTQAKWARRQAVDAGRPAYEPQPTPQIAEPARAMPALAAPAGPIMPNMVSPELTLRQQAAEAKPRNSLGRFIKSDLHTAMPLKGRELHNATLPMWYFFNRLAYKARWTRDVLRALGGGRGVKSGVRTGGAGGSFMGGFLGVAAAAKLVAIGKLIGVGILAAVTVVAAKKVISVGTEAGGIYRSRLKILQSTALSQQKFRDKAHELANIRIMTDPTIPAISKPAIVAQLKKEYIVSRKADAAKLYKQLTWFEKLGVNIVSAPRRVSEWIKKDIKYGLPQKGERPLEYRKGAVYTSVPKGFFNYKGPGAQSQAQAGATALPQNMVEELEPPEYEVPPIVMPEQPEFAVPLTDYDKQQLETLKKILQAIKNNPTGLLGEPPITGPWDSLEGDPFMQQLNTDGADSLSR